MGFAIDSGKNTTKNTTKPIVNTHINSNDIKESNIKYYFILAYESGPLDMRNAPMSSLNIDEDTEIEFIKFWVPFAPNNSSNALQERKLGIWDVDGKSNNFSDMDYQKLVLISKGMLVTTKKSMSNGYFYYNIENNSVFQTPESVKTSNSGDNSQIINKDFIYQTSKLVLDENGSAYSSVQIFNSKFSPPNGKIYVHSLNYKELKFLFPQQADLKSYGFEGNDMENLGVLHIPIYEVDYNTPKILLK